MTHGIVVGSQILESGRTTLINNFLDPHWGMLIPENVGAYL
jgi:hypothetical protein